MIRCPACESSSVTVVLNGRSRAECAECGTRWIQEGSWQRSIQRATPLRPAAIPSPAGPPDVAAAAG